MVTPLHVDDRAEGGVLVGIRHLARGAAIIIAQVLEMGADLVGHLEGVQGGVEGEEAAVVGGDVQAGVVCIRNCSWPFWKRPNTASANSPSTSTWRSRDRVKVSAASAGPV